MTTARFIAGSVPQISGGTRLGIGLGDVARPRAILVAGPFTAESIQRAMVAARGKVVVYVPPPEADSAVQQAIINQLVPQAAGLVVVSNEDSLTFIRRQRVALGRPLVATDEYLLVNRWERPWAVAVWPTVAADLLAAAGVDLAQAQAERAPVTRDLPPFDVWIDPKFTKLDETKDTTAATVPNVVALLAGSDSALKNQYVVFVTKMDMGNTVGMVGLIELARAFSQPGARPRRSLLFLAVSGGTQDFWGSSYFVAHAPVAPDRLAAAVNLGGLDAIAGDSLTIAGLGDVEFTQPLNWIISEHRELGLELADGGSAVSLLSDHSPFVRKAVPSLYVHAMRYGHDAAAGGVPPVDPAAEVRILRLVFYLGQKIANAERRPRWSPEGHRQRLRLFGQ